MFSRVLERAPLRTLLLLGLTGCALSSTPSAWDPGYARDRTKQQLYMEEATRALDLIDAGMLEKAQEPLDRLARHALRDERARLLAELIQLRLFSRAPVPTEALAGPPLETRPEDAEKAYQEGRAALRVGDSIEALRLLEKAFVLDPSHEAAGRELVDLLKRLGLEAYTLGDLDTAVSRWERALEIDPGDGETLQYLQRARSVKEKL